METQVKQDLQQSILVDPATLAKVLHVSVRTVRHLRAMGEIPVVWVTPRRPRYCVSEVIEALRKR